MIWDREEKSGNARPDTRPDTGRRPGDGETHKRGHLETSQEMSSSEATTAQETREITTMGELVPLFTFIIIK